MKKLLILFSVLVFIIIYPFNFAYGEKPITKSLFVGGKEGLYIVKFEKLNKLKIVKNIEKNEVITALKVDGNYLYVGYKNGRISIFDIKDPQNPLLISSLYPLKRTYDYPSSYPNVIFIDNNRLYISYGITGIYIIDVKDKKFPKILGLYSDGNVYFNLVVKDSYIYASFSGGIKIINATDIKNLKEVNVLKIDETNSKKVKILTISLICIDKNYLYIGDKNTLYVYEIENPGTFKLLKKKKIANFIEKLIINNKTLFIIDDKGYTLRVFTVETYKKKKKKEEITSLRLIPKGVYKSKYKIKDIEYFRDFLYLAIGKHGIEIVNMENIEKIRKNNIINIYTACVSIFAENSFIYATDIKEGLLILDKKEKGIIDLYATTKDTLDFYKTKRYGYLLQKGRLTSLAFKENGEPYRIDITNKVPNQAFRLYIEDDRLYIAALDYGLYIYDRKDDPTSPPLIKKYATEGNLYDIYPEKDILYIADGKAGIFILDTTQEEEIKILRRYKTKNPALSIYVEGDILYIGEKDGTLEVISLDDPKKIETIATLKLRNSIWKIKRKDNYLFLALGTGGIGILQIDQVYASPKLIKKIPTNGYVWDISVEDNLLWVADGENGVIAYDISEINKPKKIVDLNWFSVDILEIN